MKQRDIFIEALQKTEGEERRVFLDAACGDDVELRSSVEELLAEHRKDESFFLDAPPPGLGATVDMPAITEKLGKQIGPYKLLQQIGEGGMGTVFMAEQTEPVERRVALKIIKPGMDTQQVIARFEAERQALAMMDHPNIAKVLDAGQTDSGRPFFVMELVKGIPVTQYCDEQHLSPKERLELFVPICQAVQHAHQKGIIHRDLKPSNILIAQYDDKPVAKVIDFGVAKATSQKLTEKTMFTQYGQIVGTIEYMSPEQARFNQLDVDTRSDIYSLGVLLYELLTGETPFDKTRLRSAAFDELLRIIREEEPPRMSIRLSGSATLPNTAINRSTEPKKLSVLVRGELDWIVMKALEKDRGRRYETASKFAEDVQHYLNDEAVIACPPSAAYKFRKFARRNKAVIGTTGVIAATLIAGMIGTSWQAYRATIAERDALTFATDATQQADRADKESEKAKTAAAISQAVNDFLNKDLLAQANTDNEPDRDIKLRTVVDRAAEKIADQFDDQPLVEASIRHTLGAIYGSLGEYEKALQHVERSHQLRKATLGASTTETLLTQIYISELQVNLGDFDKAMQIAERTYEQSRRELGPLHPVTLRCLNSLSSAIEDVGRFSDAERLYRDCLELHKRVLGPDHEGTRRTLIALGFVLMRQERCSEAVPFLRQALEQSRRLKGPEHPLTLRAMMLLAQSLEATDQNAEREALGLESLAISQRVLGAEHPSTLSANHNLGVTLEFLGRYAESEVLLQETLQVLQRVRGKEHPEALRTLSVLASVLCEQGRYVEGEKLYYEVLAAQERVLGFAHHDTLKTQHKIAFFLHRQERYAEAEEIQRKALKVIREHFPPESWIMQMGLNNLIYYTMKQGKFAELLNLYRELARLQPANKSALSNLAWRLSNIDDKSLRNPAEAVGYARRAVNVDPADANNWNNLGVAQYRAGDFDAALDALLKADGMIEGGDQEHRLFLAMSLHQLGRTDEARQSYVEGAAWIDAYNKKGEQLRFRAEAEELLGLDAKRREEFIAEYYSDPPPADATVQYWRNRDLRHYLRGEYEQSVADLTRAMELKAGNGYLYRRRGTAFIRFKRWDEALSDLNEAIRIDPKDVGALIWRSETHRNLNHIEEAVADAKQATELDHGHHGAWLRLALAYEAQQEWGFAAEAFGKRFKIKPDDTRYWISYADALLASVQLEEYRTFCTELVERNAGTKDPQTARLVIFCLNKAPDAVADWTTPLRLAELVLASENPEKHRMAVLFSRAGQYRRSIEMREAVAREGQRDLNAWECLRNALAYHGLGDFERAQTFLAQADKLTADDKTLKEDPNYQRLHREVSQLLASQTAPPKEEKNLVTQTVVSEEDPEM